MAKRVYLVDPEGNEYDVGKEEAVVGRKGSEEDEEAFRKEGVERIALEPPKSKTLREDWKRVSRKHCVIRAFRLAEALEDLERTIEDSRTNIRADLRGKLLLVRDAGSRNGFSINESMKTGEQPLKRGDTLGLGPYSVTVRADD